MMDHYGDMPPPSREEAIEHTIQRIKQLNNFSLVTDEKLIEFCNNSYDEINDLGSLAGWMAFTSKQMYDKTKLKIEVYESLKTIKNISNLPDDITEHQIKEYITKN